MGDLSIIRVWGCGVKNLYVKKGMMGVLDDIIYILIMFRFFILIYICFYEVED